MSKTTTNIPSSQPHYPYLTRGIIRLFAAGALPNVRSVAVEPRYGYVAKLTYTDETTRIIYGSDLGLNNSASSDLAEDKGFTKYMLRSIGINCPEGEEFLLPWWVDEISTHQIAHGNNSIVTTLGAHDYIKNGFGYPVYVKPVNGLKGIDIFVAHDQSELTSVFAIYEQKKIRVAVIEKPFMMPDYRVVVFDGKLISAYQRLPLKIIGDGVHTIDELVRALGQQYLSQNRDINLSTDDPRVLSHLKSQGLRHDQVLADNFSATLLNISNLSAGGTSIDITDTIHPRWHALAATIASTFNLRLCGLDLACNDITSDTSDYIVIEVNAKPGLNHYAYSGQKQQQIVDDLYTQVLNAFPST